MKWMLPLLGLLLVGCQTDVRLDAVEMQRPAWAEDLPSWAEDDTDAAAADWVVTLDTRILVGETVPAAVATLLGSSNDRELILSADQLRAIESLVADDDDDSDLFTTPRLMLANDQAGWILLTADRDRGLRMAAKPEQVRGGGATLRYDVLLIRDAGASTEERWSLQGARRLQVGDVLLRTLQIEGRERAALVALQIKAIVSGEAFRADS